MGIVETRDRGALEAFFRSDPQLFFYQLGDLDDFFWPHTRWFAWQANQRFEAVALLYSGGSLPALLALSRPGDLAMEQLLRALAPSLPDRVYVHLTPGMEGELSGTYDLESHGAFIKMWRGDGPIAVPRHPVEWLGPADLPRIEALYREAYPASWFEPFMLATGFYAGIGGAGGELLAISGVHVASRCLRVAGLGNIATHPAHRGKGLAASATAAVCRALQEFVDGIGLNVRAENTAAIRCYSRLGFSKCADYREFMATRKARI